MTASPWPGQWPALGSPPPAAPTMSSLPETRGGPFFDQGYRLMERFLDLSWDGRGGSPSNDA